MQTPNVTVLGDGAMATVCAMLLAEKGCNVCMWGPFPDHLQQMAQQRTNPRYLPQAQLPETMTFAAEPAAAVAQARLILSAAPTQFVRSVWERFAAVVPAEIPVVCVAKGIENETLLLPTQIIEQLLDHDGRPVCALSGPSIALELAQQMPATVCIAGKDRQITRELQQLFTASWFRVYTNDDPLGVELAGATKNVIALAAGIIDGLGAGINAKSALLARGLAEITRLGTAMGAKAETFFGLTGVGDLATTCFSPTGRNRSCGELLGKGMNADEAQAQIKGVVEGVATARSVMALADRYQVEMPITAAVHAILFQGLSPQDAVAALMTRDPKPERVG